MPFHEEELEAVEAAHLQGLTAADALSAEALGDERAVEAALRPRTLDEVVGQARVREQLGLPAHARRGGRAGPGARAAGPGARGGPAAGEGPRPRAAQRPSGPRQ